MRAKLDRFINHKATNLVIAGLIIVSIIFLILEFSESFEKKWLLVFTIIGEILTGLFIVELLIRYLVARNKRLFFRKYWLDIIAVIPFARSLRAFRVLRLLRVFRAGSLLSRSLESFRQVFAEGRSETIVIAVTILVLVMMSGISIHFLEKQSRDFDEIGESVWWSFLSLIAGEPIGGTPATTLGKVTTAIVMLGGLTVFAMFTGLVSAVMVRRLRTDMEVKLMELDDLSSHILLCGWNRQGTLLIKEFLSDPEMKNRDVVVIAEFDDEETIRKIGAIHENVYVLKGDPTCVDILKKAGVERAKYAVLLADKMVHRLDQDRDARTILTALTLEKLNPVIYTVAELLNREGAEHLKMAGVEEVIVADDLTSNIIATSIRNSGLISLLQELFTARFGCRFYKLPVPDDFIGKPLRVVFNHFKESKNAMVISIERQVGEALNQSGHPKTEIITNPAFAEICRKSDKLILIAENPPNGD